MGTLERQQTMYFLRQNTYKMFMKNLLAIFRGFEVTRTRNTQESELNREL